MVLRRLEDALADGDHIHAVVHGVAVNNDGSDKASFTAPSVRARPRWSPPPRPMPASMLRGSPTWRLTVQPRRWATRIEVEALTLAFRQAADQGSSARSAP